MSRLTRNYRFPWREANAFKLHIDGARYFPAMLEAIERARCYVLLEMYLFESGAVAEWFIVALCGAVRRGVPVCVILDDVGSRALSGTDRVRLRQAGVHLSIYNPLHYAKWRGNLFRDHRKLLVVDGAVAFVGGTGITDDFIAVGTRIAEPWRETMLELRGAVLQDWQTLFAEHWLRCGGGAQLVPLAVLQEEGTQRGRVVFNHPGGPLEIHRSFIKRIRGAERRVWLCTAYFVPAWKLRRAFRTAVRAGIDVRLLLPGPKTDHPAVRHAGQRFYAGLLRNGVRIFEYQPRFLHAKVLLCDDWVSLGSSNVDRWSQHWNMEANQEVEDQIFAQQTEAMFRMDYEQAVELSYGRWRERSWRGRALEWFWGRIDLLLERLGR